ncbi:hypothetical protein N9Q82_04830 [Gammaproteobacteria bacterium]|jgi:hypothetical protein|nr:hypothetical protein [Gammaproteobacteria bacterium]
MKIIDWFKGKRVFPRWKLIVIVVIGVWVGLMIEEQPIFAIIFGLLGLWEFSKKGKPFD